MSRSLLEAAARGDWQVVEAELRANADPDVRDAEGRTPLMRAAAGGHLPVMRALLEGGARVDARAPDGATALVLATLWRQVGAVAVLLSHGADLTLADGEGWTPPQIAEAQGHAVIRELLERAAQWQRGRDPGRGSGEGDG